MKSYLTPLTIITGGIILAGISAIGACDMLPTWAAIPLAAIVTAFLMHFGHRYGSTRKKRYLMLSLLPLTLAILCDGFGIKALMTWDETTALSETITSSAKAAVHQQQAQLITSEMESLQSSIESLTGQIAEGEGIRTEIDQKRQIAQIINNDGVKANDSQLAPLLAEIASLELKASSTAQISGLRAVLKAKEDQLTDMKKSSEIKENQSVESAITATVTADTQNFMLSLFSLAGSQLSKTIHSSSEHGKTWSQAVNTLAGILFFGPLEIALLAATILHGLETNRPNNNSLTIKEEIKEEITEPATPEAITQTPENVSFFPGVRLGKPEETIIGGLTEDEIKTIENESVVFIDLTTKKNIDLHFRRLNNDGAFDKTYTPKEIKEMFPTTLKYRMITEQLSRAPDHEDFATPNYRASMSA